MIITKSSINTSPKFFIVLLPVFYLCVPCPCQPPLVPGCAIEVSHRFWEYAAIREELTRLACGSDVLCQLPLFSIDEKTLPRGIGRQRARIHFLFRQRKTQNHKIPKRLLQEPLIHRAW